MAYKRGNAITDSANVAGPNPYNEGARPTLQFVHLKTIRAIEDVHVKLRPGSYIVDVVSIAGNTATLRVCYPETAHTHTMATSVVPDHTHNLWLVNASVGDAGGSRVNAGANLLGENTADRTITGIAAPGVKGGIVQQLGGTHAVTWSSSPGRGSEIVVGDGVNLNGFTFRGRATGFTSNPALHQELN